MILIAPEAIYICLISLISIKIQRRGLIEAIDNLTAFNALRCADYTNARAANSHDWLNEGQRLVDQGRYTEALQAYDNGIALSPQWTDLYYHKGTAYSKLGMIDEAVEAFDKVNELNPKDGVVAYYWIGRTLSGAGRYDEAIQAYENSIKSFDTYGEWWPGQKSICAQAWYYEGLALETVGRPEEAQNAYGNAIKLDPSLTRPVTGPGTPGTGTGMGTGTGTGMGTGITGTGISTGTGTGTELVQVAMLHSTACSEDHIIRLKRTASSSIWQPPRRQPQGQPLREDPVLSRL